MLFLCRLLRVPDTTPITSGTVESEHGVNDVKIPATNAIIGATKELLSISLDMLSNISFI